MNYLLSYPRSGNTWLRYAIEYITGRPSIDEKDSKPIRRKHKDFPFVSDEPIIKKSHTPIPDKSGAGILLIRDYAECITRHNLPHSPSFKFTESYKKYMRLISCYDKWNPDKRLLIYYEDLITLPNNELSKLKKILPVDEDLYNEFVYNLEEHIARSVKYYKKFTSESKTEGKKIDFHKNKLGTKNLMKWKCKLQEEFPFLYKKYLERYRV